MVDWKSIGVPIIVAVIAGGVALVSALINYIIATLFVPNIVITKEKNHTIFDITNTGSAAAKGLKLTVQAPYNFTFKPPTFSTENYTYSISQDSSQLDVHVPRFIHGGGSMMEIEAKNGTGAKMTDDFIFYFTYDQGSNTISIPVLEQPLSIIEQYDMFWKQYTTAIIYTTLGIAAIIIGIIINNVVRKRPKVIAVSPPDESTNVPLDSLIQATFDKHIDRSTITHTTVITA